MRESNFSRIDTSKNLLNNHTNSFKAPKSKRKVLDGTLKESDLENTLKNTRAPETKTGGGTYLGREARSRRSNR